MNSVDHGFAVCRVCIGGADAVNLTPMFADGGEIARKFVLISGVDISYDFERQNDVLICSKCLAELLNAHELREKIEQYDELYFETRRLVEKVPTVKTEESEETTAMEGPQDNNEDDGNKQREPKKPSHRGHKIACNVPDCLSTFSTPQHLTRHKKTVHQNIKPFSCKVCQKKFSFKWNLKAHSRSHGNNSVSASEATEFQRFKCDECEGILSSKEALVAHVLEEHGKQLNASEIVSCPICHRVCKNMQGMRIHKTRVHDKGGYRKTASHDDAQFECEICNRVLSSSQSLRQHLETKHQSLKAKKFNCDICSLKFVAKASLKSHIVNNHPWKDDE